MQTNVGAFERIGTDADVADRIRPIPQVYTGPIRVVCDQERLMHGVCLGGAARMNKVISLIARRRGDDAPRTGETGKGLFIKRCAVKGAQVSAETEVANGGLAHAFGSLEHVLAAGNDVAVAEAAVAVRIAHALYEDDVRLRRNAAVRRVCGPVACG